MGIWGKQAPGKGSGKCKGPEAQGSLVGQGSRKETTMVGIKGEKGPYQGSSSSEPRPHWQTSLSGVAEHNLGQAWSANI